MEVTYKDDGEQIIEDLLAHYGDWVEQETSPEHGFIVAAYVSGTPVGFISVISEHLPPPLEHVTVGGIGAIEVMARYRRNGIGATLVRRAEDRCRSEGMYQLQGWSTKDKHAAIMMWKSMAYTLWPVTHSMWGREITGFFFAKVLR